MFAGKLIGIILIRGIFRVCIFDHFSYERSLVNGKFYETFSHKRKGNA